LDYIIEVAVPAYSHKGVNLVKFQGALVEKDGLAFAVVKVEKHVFDVPGRARDTMVSIQPAFPDMPIVFVTEDSAGTPAFYGRPDIVRLMIETGLNDVEWEEYAVEESETDGCR
jgi:hypothetical protein